MLLFVTLVTAVVSSLGAPLIPTISAVEDVSLETAQWSLTVTLLVATVATPTMGRLADGPHRRRVILVALAVVFIGCVLAALPLGFAALLTGRALQGVSLGLTPLAIAAARQHLPPEQVGARVATLSLAIVVGVGLGYPVTGLLTVLGGLHAGFWFGAAITALAGGLAWSVIPDSPVRDGRRLDVVGAVLLAAALAGLLVALTESPEWGWGSGRLLLVAGGSALLLLGWVGYELRTKDPLVDLRLLRRGPVALADAVSFTAAAGNYLLLTLITILVQTPVASGYGFGVSVVGAGLLLLPFSIGGAGAAWAVPALTRRFGPGSVLPVGSLVYAAGMTLFLLYRSDLVVLAVVLAVCGFGIGVTFAGLPVLIVRSVPMRETGSATGFNQVLRYVGFSLGSALTGTVLASYTPVGAAIPEAAAYGVAAAIGLGLCLFTALLSLVLPRLASRGRRAEA